MSKAIYLIDAGHGGLINGKYVTAGKRSPKFEDGTQLFEGIYNRKISYYLQQYLTDALIEWKLVYNGEEDTPLQARVASANAINKSAGKPCLYISIHGDAAGDGIQWHSATGMSVYTSIGQTKSDVFATVLLDELYNIFQVSTKWRKDDTDGDSDKEENFYVLKNTNCPSILLESGFFTNKEECKKMLTAEWQRNVAKGIFNAIMKWEKML